MSCCNCKLSIVSLIISCLALFLQIFITSFQEIDELKNSVIFKIVMCLLNASVAFVNALALGLKQNIKNVEVVEDVKNNNVNNIKPDVENTPNLKIPSVKLPRLKTFESSIIETDTVYETD